MLLNGIFNTSKVNQIKAYNIFYHLTMNGPKPHERAQCPSYPLILTTSLLSQNEIGSALFINRAQMASEY